MNKNRYLLCLLLCGVMLYYAIPRLSIETSGKESLFAIAWLMLAFFVIAGNLSAYLFTPKKQKHLSRKKGQKPRKTRGIAN
ncbi:hypothetical protein [Bacillus sp. B15-48]|uniref:hypothetical protein n=1 Tax=Bacillus sp. B15-48 TaxID=1548601 RepID=UPI00193FB217|nr:hypothetical protein [Bacillus sp. B15-48]MBM4762548.1 hypothetical protein [Bacillus sp. B15-48]